MIRARCGVFKGWLRANFGRHTFFKVIRVYPSNPKNALYGNNKKALAAWFKHGKTLRAGGTSGAIASASAKELSQRVLVAKKLSRPQEITP
jgi:hypothetical protein